MCRIARSSRRSRAVRAGLSLAIKVALASRVARQVGRRSGHASASSPLAPGCSDMGLLSRRSRTAIRRVVDRAGSPPPHTATVAGRGERGMKPARALVSCAPDRLRAAVYLSRSPRCGPDMRRFWLMFLIVGRHAPGRALSVPHLMDKRLDRRHRRAAPSPNSARPARERAKRARATHGPTLVRSRCRRPPRRTSCPFHVARLRSWRGKFRSRWIRGREGRWRVARGWRRR